MQHVTDEIHNERQTDRIDIKRRDGGALKTVQRDDSGDGINDEVSATRNFSMTRCVGMQ